MNTINLSRKIIDNLVEMQKYISNLEEIILAAEEVARKRGDKYGLCDCIDNRGSPYPSQWSADIIRGIRKDRGIKEPT